MNKKDIFEPINSMLDSTYKNTELIKPSKFKEYRRFLWKELEKIYYFVL